jgi:hypothetical protein
MNFQGRDAVQIENQQLRLTVLRQGGHIAEVLHKATGINPLWIPPWKSIEPSSYNPSIHPEYGGNEESKLLAGIMGHNLCLDMFGPPSPSEAAAGLGVHGEASVSPFQLESQGNQLRAKADLPLSGLSVTRVLTLSDDGSGIEIEESVENLTSTDRPIGWTQHVTLGPPFLEGGKTRFSVPAVRSGVFGPEKFGASRLQTGAAFNWPSAPREDGGVEDLRVFTSASSSGQFTTHLMDQARNSTGFSAFSPTHKLLFGYRWNPADFPWLGIWEENRSRFDPPWNGTTVACGMEFGVSPFPENRQQMVNRSSLFGVPTFRWLGARSRLTVRYSLFLQHADSLSDEP